MVRLGPKAVPFLSAALQDGPTMIELAPVTRFLQRRYADLRKYSSLHSDAPLRLTESEYISFHVSQLKTQYQIRAATALGAIGGPLAKQALEVSPDQPLSATVNRVVKQALSRSNPLIP